MVNLKVTFTAAVCLILLQQAVTAQVVFDDGPPQQNRRQFQNGGFGNQGFQNQQNQNPNGFGNQQGFMNHNRGFGNQNQGFGNQNQGGFGNGNPNQGGFGNGNPNQGGFGNPNQNSGFGNQNQGGFGNGNPNQGGFGNPNQNSGFGNQNQGGFGNGNPNGFGNPNQGGFGNQNSGFGNQNQTPISKENLEDDDFSSEEFDKGNILTSRQPDCRTFHNRGGFCTPLTNCDRIGRMLRNRDPIPAARLLRRSICGFSGFLPNVCCPLGRTNHFGDNNNEQGNGGSSTFPPKNPATTGFPVPPPTQPSFSKPIPPPTQPPFSKPSPTPFTRPTVKLTTTVTPVVTTTPNPFSGGGAVTLVPPKPPVNNDNGGLIMIGGGGSNPSPPAELTDQGLPSDCGFSNGSHTRIVGGRQAEKGAWPWIAALGYKDEAGNINYLCGGALISPEFVLTASHCVYKRNDLFLVRLGDHDIYTDTDGVTPQDVLVKEIIMHPKYDPNSFYNDIALLRLQKPVPFTRQVHSICLPSTPNLRAQRFENKTPFVAGWGAIQFNGPSSSVLREVQLPVVSDSVCQEKFKSFKGVNVDDTNICAGFQAGGKDACQGDSGGPLMQPVGGNKYVLIGVVSFGFKCAEPGYPGVYSRVTTHLDWIQKTITS